MNLNFTKISFISVLVLFFFAVNISAKEQGGTFVRTIMTTVDTIVTKDSVIAATTVQDSTASGDTSAIADSTRKILSKRELRIAKRDSIRYVKDSIRYIKDSIRAARPRILETYIVPDSMKYERMFVWNNDRYLNNVKFIEHDTSFNYNFTEYPFLKKDADAVYLGVIGSPTMSANYFKREENRDFKYFDPYTVYSYTPETLPFYNTKTPYTELAYWGTLFANKEKEESNVKFLHTQNLSPEGNVSVLYQRFGSNGMLKREDTDNRTFIISGNYLGKRYVMHAGYIYQGVKRSENGGIADSWFITDTVMDVRMTDVNLKSASNVLKRNTVFLNHSYGIPIRWRKGDTLAVGEGTITYFGHSAEFSTYGKKYTDQIDADDETGRNFYNNAFYIHPTNSSDSISVMSIENKLYIRLQPWAKEAILSKIDGGVGHQYIRNYAFNPDFFFNRSDTYNYNNMFVYAGASGQFRKYFAWNGFAEYFFAGYNVNDFNIKADARLSFYPIPRGIHLNARFLLSGRRPDWFSNNLYTNHHRWSNNFSKVTTTGIEGTLTVPRYRIEAFFGYRLVDGMTYYDTEGTIHQHNVPVSIMSAYLKKNFTLWKLHLDNQALFQMSSDNNVLPLPLLTLNLRYYLEFELVRNVLKAQLGASAIFNTEYYVPSYDPALGVFKTQNIEKYGNNPYVDLFVNLQWKRASIFVKYVNASQNWFNSEYFSAYNYIRPQRAFKVGIHWPFYIK